MNQQIIHHLTWESRNFKFDAYGYTAQHARFLLEEGWRQHCQQYPDADKNLLNEYAQDIRANTVPLGTCLRDYEPLVSNLLPVRTKGWTAEKIVCAEDNPFFHAYHVPQRRWNGFIMPCFEREEAEWAATYLCFQNENSWQWEGDTLVYIVADGEEGEPYVERNEPFLIEVDGEIKKVWEIIDGLCWMEYGDYDEQLHDWRVKEFDDTGKETRTWHMRGHDVADAHRLAWKCCVEHNVHSFQIDLREDDQFN